MRFGLLCTATAIAVLPVSAAAQDRKDVDGKALFDALVACRAISGDAERLACFDRTAGSLAAAREQNQVVVVDREGMRQAKRAVFGFSLPKIKLFGNDNAEPELKAIDSTLAGVRGYGAGLYVLSLEDGTGWQTLESQIGMFPKKGDAVHIEAGILGSYKAKIGGRRSVKVKRIR